MNDYGGTAKIYIEGTCRWCSDNYNQVWHAGLCPNIKSIEYYQNGIIKKVEFVEPYNNITKMEFTMIDGELRVVENSSPPGLTPLPEDAGILSVRN